MPLEDRRITFSAEELYQAVYAHCRRADKKLPPAGEIKSVGFIGEEDNTISMIVENRMENTSVTLEYTKNFIAAALIMYCRGVGVPIPKSASKSIEIGKDLVTLRAVM